MSFSQSLAVLSLLTLFISGVGASPSFHVKSSTPLSSVTSHLAILKDEQADLTFEQLLESKHQGYFIDLDNQSSNFGFTQAVYWVKLTLENSEQRDLSVIIRQDYPLIDYLEFWSQTENNQWQSTKTGDRLEYQSRPLETRDFVFPVTLPASSSQTFYFRFQTSGSMNIGLWVSEQREFLGRLANEQLLYGIYYGGFLVLVIYNLFLFMAVRDKAYVFYMVYAISYGIYFSVHNGFAFQYLWPDSPWLANQSLLVLLALTLIFGVKFARLICSGSELAPRTDKIASVLQWFTVALLLITPWLDYRFLVLVYSVETILICFVLLALGCIGTIQRSRPAIYFTIGWITLLVSVIVYMLKTFGWLPHNLLTQNAFQVGALLEMVLLSLALGARVSDIHRMGFFDALSTLNNRRYFDQKLEQEFAFARKSKTPLSLLMIDIDHFKVINDTHGHAKGDLIIRELGQLLRQSIRKPAIACRFGGEEFAVLLPRTSIENALHVAERIRTEIESKAFFDIKVTISVGVSSTERASFQSPIQLFEAADSALYAAKDQGRNRSVSINASELAEAY